MFEKGEKEYESYLELVQCGLGETKYRHRLEEQLKRLNAALELQRSGI